MEPDKLIEWKCKLEAKREDLQEQLLGLKKAPDREVTKDIGENAGANTAGDLRAITIQRVNREINLIGGALRRIELGTFGTCRSCEEPIPEARLDALPHVSLCITCESREQETSAPLVPIVHERRRNSHKDYSSNFYPR